MFLRSLLHYNNLTKRLTFDPLSSVNSGILQGVLMDILRGTLLESLPSAAARETVAAPVMPVPPNTATFFTESDIVTVCSR